MDKAFLNYTHNDLEIAFNLVKNKTHWKDPINALIEPKDIPSVDAAIRYFTATEPKFTCVGRVASNSDSKNCFTYFVHVEAAGYRAGPAGDH